MLNNSIFLLVGTLIATAVQAQPDAFSFTPTNLSGTFLGTALVNGAPAAPGDWVAAFDESGNCAGAAALIENDGQTFINLPIYGDDPLTTGTDEGMSPGESFTLRLWRMEEDQVLTYPSEDASVELVGWANTNGAPIPVFSDPFTQYNFQESSTVSLVCPVLPMCETDDAIAIGAFPEGGTWSGQGISASGVFDPMLSGPGNIEIFYQFLDQTVSCTVVVDASPDATILTTAPICPEDEPLQLEAVDQGGSWSGQGVFSGQFDPSFTGPGSFEINYTVTNGSCTASSTIALTVYPEAPDATAEQVGDYLVLSWDGPSEIDIQWIDWITGEPIPGGTTASVNGLDEGLYAGTLTTVFGCTSTSNPVAYVPVGIAELPDVSTVYWLDGKGHLQPETEIFDAVWYDLSGKMLGEGAVAPACALGLCVVCIQSSRQRPVECITVVR